MSTQPRPLPSSLELEASKVAVVENLTNNDPSHIVGYHTALGPGIQGADILENSPVVANVLFSNCKYDDVDDESVKTNLG